MAELGPAEEGREKEGLAAATAEHVPFGGPLGFEIFAHAQYAGDFIAGELAGEFELKGIAVAFGEAAQESDAVAFDKAF